MTRSLEDLAFIAGKTIRKHLYVPGKIVNLLVG